MIVLSSAQFSLSLCPLRLPESIFGALTDARGKFTCLEASFHLTKMSPIKQMEVFIFNPPPASSLSSERKRQLDFDKRYFLERIWTTNFLLWIPGEMELEVALCVCCHSAEAQLCVLDLTL